MHFGRLLCTVFHEAEEDQDVIFLANNFKLVTMLIAAIIKKRRQIELFFK